MLSPFTLLLAAIASLPSVALAQAWDFREDFTGGMPASPAPWQTPGWDITVHSRNSDRWRVLDAMPAQHGNDCAPPPASHVISAYEHAVYVCHEHLMTALRANGYGMIYLTPDRLVDMTQGTATIAIDVSTLRLSGRDWWDLWLTPWDDNLQLPLQGWLPDVQGAPRNAVHITMDTFSGTTVFDGSVYRNYVEEALPGGWQGYETWLTPSARVRETFELQISRTHVRFGMPAYGRWWIDMPIADLGFDQAVLQIGHHSYDPTKPDPSHPIGHQASLAGVTTTPAPNTWHWDDIRISHAIPFDRVAADRRFVSSRDVNRSVRFVRPAPNDAWLRFSAIGAVSVSFDGAAWLPARRQNGSNQHGGGHAPEHFSSYWMPVPAGTREVEFRFAADGWYDLEMAAKDFAIWSRAVGGVGCAGLGGAVPELSHGQPLLGNAAFGFDLTNARPSSPSVLMLGLREMHSYAPCAIQVDLAPGSLLLPNGSLGGVTVTATGDARVPLPLPAGSPALIGRTLYAQWLVLDAAGALQLPGIGLAASPLRRFTLR